MKNLSFRANLDAAMHFTKRSQRLGTESAFEILARVQGLERQGRSILHFEMGQLEGDTPDEIVEAAIVSLREGRTRYTEAAGELELRKRIAQDVLQSRGVEVHPEEVVIGPGAKPPLFFAIQCLVDHGDEVLLPDPGFPIFESAVRYAGGVPVFYTLRMENEFRPDLAEFRKLFSSKTRLAIVNSPHNPTGGVLSREDLKSICDFVMNQKDCWLLSDEIYSEMIFDEGQHFSPISIPGMKEKTILIDGFSKSFAMTGWRLGYGIMPAALADLVTRLGINIYSCVPPFIQDAGCAALQKNPRREMAQRISELQHRRDRLVEGLNSLPGFRCISPRASLYTFPNIERTGVDERKLQQILLEELGIACLAGSDFGPGGGGHLRFSLTEPAEAIDEAIGRIQKHGRFSK